MFVFQEELIRHLAMKQKMEKQGGEALKHCEKLTKTKERWRQQIRKIQVIGVIGFKKTIALWDI